MYLFIYLGHHLEYIDGQYQVTLMKQIHEDIYKKFDFFLIHFQKCFKLKQYVKACWKRMLEKQQQPFLGGLILDSTKFSGLFFW